MTAEKLQSWWDGLTGEQRVRAVAIASAPHPAEWRSTTPYR